MESLNKNGVSITQTPGEEKYIECCLGAFRGQIYIQYDYRHTNGKLFSTVAKTLEICRQRRDEWLKKASGNGLRPISNRHLHNQIEPGLFRRLLQRRTSHRSCQEKRPLHPSGGGRCIGM
jgi:hypothetical protein